ncbi:MAG: hypothetical protein R2731_04255 [Nocardioides sp.]
MPVVDERGLASPKLAQGHCPAGVDVVVAAERSQLGGPHGDGRVEVVGVGQVEGGGDVDRAVEGDLLAVHGDVPPVGRLRRATSGELGVDPAAASSTSRSRAVGRTRWATEAT